MDRTTTRLLADLDTGKTTCCLHELLQAKREQQRQTPSVAYFLGFAGELKHRAHEVHELIQNYRSAIVNKPEGLHAQLVTQSVASWIFHNNRIEFAGTSSEGETEAIITNQTKPANTPAEKEVLQTLQLLQRTHSSDPHLQSRSWSVEKLSEYHAVLFQGLLEHPGQLRKAGAYADGADGSKHLFPHHTIIPPLLSRLCILVGKLAKQIDDGYPAYSPEHLLYSFALAAFAQLHFVDIHPFIDGNGRMCRFISKRILDAHCPLPFPMFKSRELYLSALISAGSKTPQKAPLKLMQLLLDSASDFYRSTIQCYLDRPFTKLLAAVSTDGLQRLLADEAVPEEDHRLIR
ncbi:Fido domain-containing protein [Balamuthia mandrillaris]